MEGEDETMFPIMSLPEEVRGRIYNFLEQKEAMKFRIICRQWQKEIHIFYNYHLNLDENNSHLQKLRKILDRRRQRITACTTGQFLLAPPNRTTIFKIQNSIQSLNISKTPISPENFHALLIQCAKSLKRLEIHLLKPLLRYEYPLTHFNFPNLSSLVVNLCSCCHEEIQSPVLQAHVDQEVLMINRLVRDSYKPKLANLSFSLYYQNRSQLDWYSSTILSTVVNHSNTLCRLSLEFLEDSIGLDCVRGIFPSFRLGQKDWAQIRKVDNNINYLAYYDDGVGVMNLESLSKLTIKKLETLKMGLTNFEWTFLQKICLNCFGSLVSIYIMFSHCTIRTFDASCLKDCKNLKELFLNRQVANTMELDDSYSFCNFHLLPESIVDLQIDCISILTTELEWICTSGLKSLKELRLRKCGVSGLYGVCGKVFQKVVLLPKLCKFLVTDLRFAGPEEEANFIEFRDSLIPIVNYSPKRTAIYITRESPLVPFRRGW